MTYARSQTSVYSQNFMDSDFENLKQFRPNSPRWTTFPINVRAQAEHMLQNAVLMTEMGIELKDKTIAGQKYISYLRSLAVRAGKTMNTLQSSSKAFLLLAQRLVQSVMTNIDSIPVPDQACMNLKLDFERLLNVIEKELADTEESDGVDPSASTACGAVNVPALTDRIRFLETKQKLSDNYLLQSNSAKSVKLDVDEKYPENVSRESLIDLNNVVNLPTVPEDVFTSFSNKPARTSSLSSLKSIRKVKLFLQRASNVSDDEDESSEPEDHDVIKSPLGSSPDCDEGKLSNTYLSTKKGFLGNIEEEAQQD